MACWRIGERFCKTQVYLHAHLPQYKLCRLRRQNAKSHDVTLQDHRQCAHTLHLGSAPSAIWRGDVLMCCGPAFDLWGGIRRGSRYQNRVVLDGVERFELHQPSGLPVLQMQLEQRTRQGGRVRLQGVG